MKMFGVFSTDQVLARYLLSPALMRRIVDYNRQVKRHIYMSFIDGVVYVAVKTGFFLFEPKVFRPLDPKSQMRSFDDIHVVLGIIEELNLNTRIWNKR